MTASRLRTITTLLASAMLVAGAAGCAKRKAKTAEDRAFLSAEVLYQRGIEQLAQDNLAKARTDLERIRFTTDNLQLLEPLVKLRLADVTFFKGDDLSLIDARSKYLDFVVLHSDHPLAPYAQFQAGICSLKQVSAPTLDQTQTHTALGEFREVVRRWPGSEYARAAEGVVVEAENELAEHEYSVGRFYFKRKKYNAAASRFRGILDRYPTYAQKDEVYLYLGQALVLNGDDIEGKSYLTRLVEDHPEGRFTDEAKKFMASAAARENKKKKGSQGAMESEPDADTGTAPTGSPAPSQNSRD